MKFINSIYAIVLARKNSERIVNKNLTLFKNKPLIEWTFDEAKKSEYIKKIICSTDDERIIKKYDQIDNISFPYIRPSYLATKKTKSEETIIHLLNFYEKKNKYLPKNFILLQPTSPLRTVKDIDKAIKKYQKIKSTRLVSITKIKNVFNIQDNEIIIKSNNSYKFNGSIYICNTKDFLKNKKIFVNNRTNFLTIDQERSLDVDYPSQIIK